MKPPSRMPRGDSPHLARRSLSEKPPLPSILKPRFETGPSGAVGSGAPKGAAIGEAIAAAAEAQLHGVQPNQNVEPRVRSRFPWKPNRKGRGKGGRVPGKGKGRGKVKEGKMWKQRCPMEAECDD